MSITRPARDTDVTNIATVHVRSWQAAYRGLMPEEFLSRLSVNERAGMWRRTVSRSKTDVLVVEDEVGSVVGFCWLVKARDSDADATTGEIVAFYIEPDRWRQGHGAALFEGTLACARRRGFTELTLWVIEGNHAAQRFYEALGFRSDGHEKLEDGWGGFRVREIRLRRDVQG